MLKIVVVHMLMWQTLSDPVSELKEMEDIMVSLFPYNMLLNSRVGADQLATKIAGVFGIDYRSTRHLPQGELLRQVRSKPGNQKTLYFQVNHLTESRKPRVNY